MRWFLVKALCITAAGAIAAILWGDILAGILIAPFGWIVGKTAQVWSEAGRVPVVLSGNTRKERKLEEEILPFEHWRYCGVYRNPVTNPRYVWMPGNVYSDEDW